MRIRTWTVGAATLSLCGLFLLTPSPSTAANAVPANFPPGAVVTAMTAVPITGVVVPVSGPAEVSLANGVTLQIPASQGTALATARAADDAQVSPDNEVFGSCGYSYMETAANSNNSGIIIATGFYVEESVIGTPISFLWQVDGENETYGRGYSPVWSGSLSSDLWSNPFTQALKGTGEYDTQVETFSYALGTRDACYSGGPHSVTTVS